MIKALIFDWGDTVMRDFPACPGSMAEWEQVEWIPDLQEPLKILNKKFTCCIASNAGFSDASLMKKALERVGAEKYFHFFFTSKDLGYEKPDSRFFQTIAEEINIIPEECIMIGNVYKKDICGAKAVGMKTIFFNENKRTGDFPDADKIIFSMKELMEAIDSLT